MSKQLLSSFRPGEWISGTPYRVVRRLGVGGMGEVYEVDHTRTGTRRAIKVVRMGLGADAGAERRLVREARELRAIEHPNVVRVFEAGALTDGRPYFAMELLEGMSVKRLSKQGPLSVARSAGLVVQVLEGLAAIHARKIVHRDVKPSNLFVDLDGVVKVLDLGILKLIDANASAPQTRVGTVVGTTRYMSPEQVWGHALDARSDLYAAGLVLFELVAGRHPFDELSACDVFERFERPMPRLGDVVNVAMPSGFDAVVQRALSVDRGDRFDSAVAFADALRPFAPPRTVSRVQSAVRRARWERDPGEADDGGASSCKSPSTVRWLVALQVAGVVVSLMALLLSIGAAWIAKRGIGDVRECGAAALHERGD